MSSTPPAVTSGFTAETTPGIASGAPPDARNSDTSAARSPASATAAAEGFFSPSAATVRFSPSGGLLVAAFGRVITIWDAHSRRPVRLLLGHQGDVGVAFFSGNERRLFSAGRADRTLRLWRTGSLLEE